jgi:hypothetical protein
MQGWMEWLQALFRPVVIRAGVERKRFDSINGLDKISFGRGNWATPVAFRATPYV